MFRQFAIGVAVLIAALMAGGSAQADAQSWPDRPVKIVMPYPPGGGGDGVARALAQKLGELLQQRFIVENRPGASGMIGASVVAKADPDGYTLLVASPVEVSLAPTLFKTMSYDPLTEFVPVSQIAWTPLIIAVHPSFPASTVAELVALIKKEPTNYSHPGIGSSHHLTGEYINKLVGGKLVPVFYRGAAPAITDAVGGQLKLTIAGLPPAVPFLQSGSLKGIAVTSKRRSPLFPDIPALAETKGFEDVDTTNWFGLLAPKNTPAAIINKLHHAVVQALQDDRVLSALKAQALQPVGGTPAEFGAFIRAETAKYAKIVEITGVTAN